MIRLIALLAVLALTLGAVQPVEAQRKKTPTKRTTAKKPKKSAGQLRTDLSALRRRKEQLRRELATARRATKEVQSDIKEIDARIERLQDQLQETRASLHKSQRQQEELADQLDDATVRVAQIKQQVLRRLRHMYMHKGESVLSAFASAKSIGDIASYKLLMESVARKDRAIFDEHKRLQAFIAGKKRQQDRVVAEVRRLRDRQVDQQARMEVSREQKAETLQDLRSKQHQLRALIAQLEADEASIYAQIRAYEAARRRRNPNRPPLPAFTGRFMKPTRGPITSGYGMRMHPILKYRRLHAGMDFGGGAGSPIYAAASGEVIAAQYSRSYGNMVIIDHGGGISTVYAHASRLYVRTGQTVRRGQVIAAIGSTGLSTGPHLHWEVRVNGRAVNPMSRM